MTTNQEETNIEETKVIEETNIEETEIEKLASLIQKGMTHPCCDDDEIFYFNQQEGERFLTSFQNKQSQLSADDFWTEVIKKETETHFYWNKHHNKYLSAYINPFETHLIKWIPDKTVPTDKNPFVHFEKVASTIFKVLEEIEKKGCDQNDQELCDCYLEENMKKTYGKPFCYSWNAIIEMILFYIFEGQCNLTLKKIITMFKNDEMADFLLESKEGLPIFPCYKKHKPNTLDFKTIKTRIFQIINKKSVEYRIQMVYMFCKNNFSNDDKNPNNEDDLMAFIRTFIKQNYSSTIPIPKLYFSNTYFKKNKGDLEYEIRKILVEKHKSDLEKKKLKNKTK